MFTDASWTFKIGAVVGGVFTILLANVVRNLYFHPLSGFPGPKLWAASRIPYIVSLFRGNLVVDFSEIHRKYGNVVRVAPGELSFAAEEAWHDIYVHRTGHQDPAKDPVWYKAPEDMPQNIVTATDMGTHSRMRKALAPSFTEKALRSQTPTIERYGDLLISRLREVVSSGSAKDGTVLDMVDWMTFFTVDIIGDLALGESFRCLENGELHPWVKTLNSFLRGMVYAAATRYYPIMETVLMKMLPKSVMELQRQHAAFANEKVNKRLSLETQRQDFVTPFLEGKADMSLKEIQSNFAILIVAGADTTATSLAGTLLYLVKNPSKLKKLEKEIRETFEKAEDITVGSTAELPYLGAAIDEGLRLCNPVPGGLPRKVPKGGDHYAGQFVPEHTTVSVRPYSMSRSDAYFKNAASYEPERWLSDSSRPKEFNGDRLAVSQPFGIGHSNCLGKKLAWAEMRLVIARLVFDFDIEESAPEQDWAKLKTYMITDKGRIEIRLRLRDANTTNE